MNAFAIAGTALLFGFLPLAVVALRAIPIDGVVALQLGGTIATLALLCLSESFRRSSYFDLPVICAVMTWAGGLVFARFLGRFL